MLKNLKTYWLLPWVLAFVLGCQKEKVPEPQIAKASETPATYLDSTMLPPEPLFCIEKEALNLSKEEFHKRIQGRWVAVQQKGSSVYGDGVYPRPSDTTGRSFFVVRVTSDSLVYYDSNLKTPSAKHPYEIVLGGFSGSFIARMTTQNSTTGQKIPTDYYLCSNAMLTADRTFYAGEVKYIAFDRLDK